MAGRHQERERITLLQVAGKTRTDVVAAPIARDLEAGTVVNEALSPRQPPDGEVRRGGCGLGVANQAGTGCELRRPDRMSSMGVETGVFDEIATPSARSPASDWHGLLGAKTRDSRDCGVGIPMRGRCHPAEGRTGTQPSRSSPLRLGQACRTLSHEGRRSLSPAGGVRSLQIDLFPPEMPVRGWRQGLNRGAACVPVRLSLYRQVRGGAATKSASVHPRAAASFSKLLRSMCRVPRSTLPT